MRAAASRFVAFALVSLWPDHAALAQRTTQNVTTQASDAFGRSVGTDKNGLYGPDDVRGFNPVDAGNVRVEGLYADVVDKVPNRLVDGSTVRVGIAAQRYAFPAPTGLIDYDLNVPASRRLGSFQVDNASGNNYGLGGNVEFSLPLAGDDIAIFGAVGGRHNRRPEGGEHDARALGTSVRFRPSGGSDILLFGGAGRTWGEEATATLFPVAGSRLPVVSRGRFLGQNWTTKDSTTSMFGVVVRQRLGPLRLEGGLFRSNRTNGKNFSDSLIGVDQDGRALNRVVVGTLGNRDTSVSGEVRLVREWSSGAFDHIAMLSYRGRNTDRLFGGSGRISLGPSSAVTTDFRPEPTFIYGPHDKDRVRQRTYGVFYSAMWRGGATLDVSVSRSNYRKAVDFAAPGVEDATTSDSPLLGNLSASLRVRKSLVIFGGYSRGMESALVAPDIAINRSESPPAIRTAQKELGLRIALAPKLALIASAFQISKPYYNLDPALRYRELGMLVNRGLEFSLSGEVRPGLSLVVGTLLLDPRIAGEAVAANLIGVRPVGQLRRRTVLNMDYRLGGGQSPLSFDLAAESVSSRFGNSANTVAAPPATTVNAGVRYRFSLGGATLVVRAQVQNLFDAYRWNVSPSGGFTYAGRRSLFLQLVGDI